MGMKKIFYLLVIGILALSTAVTFDALSTVYADDSPTTITISSNATELKPGDTVKITVHIRNNQQYDLSNLIVKIERTKGLTFLYSQTNVNQNNYNDGSGSWNVGNLKKTASGGGQEPGTKELYLYFKVNNDFNGTIDFVARFTSLTTWYEDEEVKDLVGFASISNSLSLNVVSDGDDDGSNSTHNETNNNTNQTNNNTGDNGNNNGTGDGDTNNETNTGNNNGGDNETIKGNITDKNTDKNNVTKNGTKEKTSVKSTNKTKNKGTDKKSSDNPFKNSKSGKGISQSSNHKSPSSTKSLSNATGVNDGLDPLDSSDPSSEDSDKKPTEIKNSSSNGSSGSSSNGGGMSEGEIVLTGILSLMGLGTIGYFYGLRR